MKEIAGKRLKKLPPTYLALLGCFCQLSKEAKCQKQSKFWSVLHFHERRFEKHGSLILFKTFWLFWVSFVEEITTVFFFTQTKVIVPWKQIRVWQRIINVIYGLFSYVCFLSEVSQLLPEQGADVNAQTKSGKVSSLHRAAYSGHMSVMNLLIKYGADPRLCDLCTRWQWNCCGLI